MYKGISKNSIICLDSPFRQPSIPLKTFVLPSKGEMICGNGVFRDAHKQIFKSMVIINITKTKKYQLFYLLNIEHLQPNSKIYNSP